MDAGSTGIIFDDLESPEPGLQGHRIPTNRISQKRCILGTKLLKNTNRIPQQSESIELYHFQ